MDPDGSTCDTRIYTGLGASGVLYPNPAGAAALLVFVCLVTGAIAPSYEVDWNEAMV